MQKCGGRIETPEEIKLKVQQAIAAEDKRDTRRLGAEHEANKVDAVMVCQNTPEMEAIVQMNTVSGTNSLSQVEWLSMEAAMPAEERLCHRNLSIWMAQRANAANIKAEADDESDDDDLGDGDGDDDDGSEDEEDKKAEAEAKAKADAEKAEKEKEEEAAADKAKNWSSVNLACVESKLTFRGSLTAVNFTNWLWFRVIRTKLEETKSKMGDHDIGQVPGLEECEDIMGEFCPAKKVDKDEKKSKDDKKDKKDDKKDKKGKDDKKDKKDEKDDKKKDKAKKKDEVKLNSKEKLQVQNLIKNMVYGESGKSKSIACGWVNMLEEKEIPVLTPWEFQLAHVMRTCMVLEYQAKKKKEMPANNAFYEAVQSLADAIGMVRKQYVLEFGDAVVGKAVDSSLLPLVDAVALQARFRGGSCGGLKFDLLWYLRYGAHLLAGSHFAKRHVSTVFKPFKIQELMADAVLNPGPQLVFAIAPPGTGKTAIVGHLLHLFPGHTLVFCCAALPVVLGVGRIANALGIPYAFVKGRRITPSYSCGRGLATHVDIQDENEPMTAVQSLRHKVVELNLGRKKRRLAEKKRKRNLHDLKRMPKMYMMCDTASCAWLLRQLDPNRSILCVDEPPMGSDRYPEAPKDNILSVAMIQAMMTPMYKTVWISATLPRVDALPILVNSFLERFKLPLEKRADHVRECFSTELDRGVVLCGPNGTVAFPHQCCKDTSELQRLCERLPADPLVLKSYTERALSALLARWQLLEGEGKLTDGFKKNVIHPDVRFADLSEINHNSIRAYALELLVTVCKEGNDELVKAFCLPGDEAEEKLFPEFDLQGMMFHNAYAYPGLTLVADDTPAQQMLHMSQRLQDQMPSAKDLDADLKAQEGAAERAAKFQEDDEVVETVQPKLKFAAELVIQSDAFLKKWCVNRPEGAPTLTRLLPTVPDFLVIKQLPVNETWQMLALSGAGSFDPTLDVDPGNPAYTQWVHESMTAHKLCCVTAGKEFTWGANVPASTVVVTSSFAEHTSVAGMLQYVGRAARRGLTTHGQAVFERNEDLERIFASPDGLSTEAKTMERYARWWKTAGKEW